MEPELLGFFVTFIVFILTVAGVILLRPISKRLGDLIEIYSRERQAGAQVQLHQVRDLLETMNARLELLEDRQDFTERLLSSDDKEQLPRAT